VLNKNARKGAKIENRASEWQGGNTTVSGGTTLLCQISGMVGRPPVVTYYLLLLCLSLFTPFRWIFARLRLLPTKVNKTSENPKDYIRI